MSQFITNTEFTYSYDWRRIADFVTQDNTRATLAEITNTATPEGAIVQLMIQTASEYIVSAATVGMRYTRDILDGVAASGTGSSFILKRMTAIIAFGYLVSRRALPPEQLSAMAPDFAWAESLVEQFRRGDRIFADVAGVEEAGLPTTASMTPVNKPPTWTMVASPFFGCTPTLLNNPPYNQGGSFGYQGGTWGGYR